MKRLILPAGHGTRLRLITYSQQKHLIAATNNQLPFYVIEDIIESGVNEIVIRGRHNKGQIRGAMNVWAI